MVDVTIKIGPSLVMTDDRLSYTENLADALRARGLMVDLVIIEQHPLRHEITHVEWTFVTIASTEMLDGVFDVARRSLGARYQARKAKENGRDVRPLGVVIYGSDGSLLTSWDTWSD